MFPIWLGRLHIQIDAPRFHARDNVRLVVEPISLPLTRRLADV
jgi:hypothetical protein